MVDIVPLMLVLTRTWLLAEAMKYTWFEVSTATPVGRGRVLAPPTMVVIITCYVISTVIKNATYETNIKGGDNEEYYVTSQVQVDIHYQYK